MINTHEDDCGDGKRPKVWYCPYKFQAYGEEEIKAVEECLRDGWLAPGPRTAKFENMVSKFCGKKYGVMVNSGSAGNTLALLIAGVKEGDEVVTPACTFSTVLAPLIQMRAVPVFCDVELDTYVPSVEQVLACVTEKTKCIYIPDLAGSKPDWKRLRELVPAHIPLIEDACDTMSFTAESDYSVVSFYASHVITAGGGGGMVMMNTEQARARALCFRDWGRTGNNQECLDKRFTEDIDGIMYDGKYAYSAVGYNFKSSEMNAAFGIVQMNKLPGFLQTRRDHIARYIRRLSDSPLGMPNNAGNYDWLAMPLRAPAGERRNIMELLEYNNIQTRVFFAGNITRHPAYRDLLTPFENADIIMADVLLVGAHHGLTESDVDYVCDVLLSFFEGARAPAKYDVEEPDGFRHEIRNVEASKKEIDYVSPPSPISNGINCNKKKVCN